MKQNTRRIQTTESLCEMITENIHALFEQAPQTFSGGALVHADDGILWGLVQNGQYLWPSQSTVQFRRETLQTMRLFNTNCELYLWRIGNGEFRLRSIIDDQPDEQPIDYFDEDQILWGTHPDALDQTFTRMADGAEGLQHIVPIPVKQRKNGERPLRLTVRHYLHSDANGLTRIAYSRLVNLFEKELNNGRS